jgi:hypothetical protein
MSKKIIIFQLDAIRLVLSQQIVKQTAVDAQILVVCAKN